MDNVTNEDIVQGIDAEIDAILNEDVTSDPVSSPADSTPTGNAGLVAKLRQLGVADEIPENPTTEQLLTLLDKTVDTADTRVRGFQSGFDKERETLGNKAAAFDRLLATPGFAEWLENGQAPAPAAPKAEVELDLNSLPEDPNERMKVLFRHYANVVIDERLGPINERVNTVGAVVGNLGWQGFVAKYPDAPQFKPEIDRFIARGFTAEEAYRYAKGASVDPKAIQDDAERRAVEAFRTRYQEKRKATNIGIPATSPGTNPTGVDYNAIGKEQGLGAAILAAINDTDKELGGIF